MAEKNEKKEAAKKEGKEKAGQAPVHRKKARSYASAGKHSKIRCAVCGSLLHGVPHGRSKSGVNAMGRTEKRPSAKFGGVLCAGCRKIVAEEKAKVASGFKRLEDVDFRYKKYVLQMRVLQ